MTPQDFIARWRASPKDERRDAQPHFLDLCRLIGVETPAEAKQADDCPLQHRAPPPRQPQEEPMPHRRRHVIRQTRRLRGQFRILHPAFHELSVNDDRQSIGEENRRRSTTFETFPFPEGLTPDLPAAAYAADPRAQAIAAAAARLNELRETWLKPPDLVRRVPEVVAGYPDRLLPVDDAAAAVLRKRTLTNLYNARPAWLDHAHARLDEAVAEAYGWGGDWRAGKLGGDGILARLFALNQARG